MGEQKPALWSPRLCCLLTIPPRVHRRSRRRRWALRLLDTGVGDDDGTHGRQEPVERMEMRVRWDGAGKGMQGGKVHIPRPSSSGPSPSGTYLLDGGKYS